MKFLTIFALTIAAAAATKIPLTNADSEPLSASESKGDAIIASASVGDVEVPAVVQEVGEDWLDGEENPSLRSDDAEGGEEDEQSLTDEEEDGSVDDEEEEVVEDDEEDFVDYDEEEMEEEDYADDDYDEAYVESRYDYDYGDSLQDVATQEEFEANVPTAIHGNKDIIIHKDNILPILKTIVIAYTHKKKPTYSDLLKAGGVSAFKTGFKFLGKENLGENLLKLAKKLTSVLDDEEDEDLDTGMLAEMAEAYLSSHRFKLVLPESVLLHQKEMEEFLDKKPLDQMEGRSLVTNKQFDISMPRADPAVHTVLTIGPMTWMALLGGLFSIPYFFSGSEDIESARVDHIVRGPSPYLSPPGLPFFRTHQLRRDETEQIPHQQIDQEYLEYQQSYNQWYHNWYLRYKSYYDEHYPNHQTPHPHPGAAVAPEEPSQEHQQPHLPVVPPHAQSSLDIMVPPPPVNQGQAKVPHQKPLHPPVKPLPAKERLPKQPPPINFNAHTRPQVPLEIPRRDAGRHAAANILSNSEPAPNTFGTFQSEKNKGDSHFRVIQGSDLQTSTTPEPVQQPTTPSANPTTVRSKPKAPNPRPVYIPTTEVPKTERGFKPITKPDSPDAKPGATTPSSPDNKEDFKPPREDSLLGGETSKPKTQETSSSSESIGTTAGGFKPIPPPANAAVSTGAEGKNEPETSTRRVSGVTSGVFKTTAAPTPSPDTTPVAVVTSRPAVFIKTATQKSVRVVTSSSFVVPDANEGTKKQLPDLKRPQRHQQSTPEVQEIKNLQTKPQQPLPVHQPLPLQQPKPALVVQQVPPASQQRPTVQQAQLVSHHQTPVVQQAAPVIQNRPVVQQAAPAFQQRPAVQQAVQEFPVQQTLVAESPRPNVQNTGFVRTNVPTTIKVVDHRPAQGFGLGPRPNAEPTTTTTTTTTTPMPIYALDPFYGSRLSRIDVIFHHLGVQEEGCREQVVCNIYKNPDVYTPYSDFLSRQLTVKLEELQRPKVSDERILRFFRYLKAAREGQDGSDCNSKYPECPIDTTQLSHKPIMNAFQKVSLLMNAGSS